MHYVIEAHFDDLTALRLENVRSQLHQAGFALAPIGTPHLSLSSFQDCEPEEWEAILRTCASMKAIVVEFSFIGLFTGPTCILYQGITPTVTLRALHERIHQQAIEHATQLHALYRPGRVVFHSTLAAPIKATDVGAATQFAATSDLPRSGLITRLALVRYFPATTLFSYDMEPLDA